ncbi:MAG: dihydrolipoamide dehydrogenase [Cryomorphaceae bacterium]|jgi:dihydrolipoamide dehydrogenase
MDQYDVVIIGSGPGGYVCAIRCAQLGMKTAIIEKYSTLGGTCLNVGCIPSKALLDSSEHYFKALHEFAEHGIELKDLKVNLPQMIKRKAEVVDQTTKGIDFLMKKNDITVLHGMGSFIDKETVKVSSDEGDKEIKAKRIVIATGSKPNFFPGMEPDKDRIITSTEALELLEVPKKMVVVGGGVIGLELGSVYARIGSEVTVVEFTDGIISTMDRTLGKELAKVLKKEGVKFNFNHKVQKVENTGKGVKVTALDKKGAEVTFEADYCLVSVGRKPYTQGLGLENAGLTTDDRGRIDVNDQLRTKVDNIYAIGDVVRGAMLAHKAEEEGVLVAEVMAGQKPHINYKLIPNVVYTWPEVAGVGYTEEELKADGKEYKTGTFPMRALGRARASGDTHGLVKILADKETDEILGVHMIGPRVADLISEGVVAMEYRASAEDIARMSHAHPTYSEAVKEAALAATEDRAMHI